MINDEKRIAQNTIQGSSVFNMGNRNKIYVGRIENNFNSSNTNQSIEYQRVWVSPMISTKKVTLLGAVMSVISFIPYLKILIDLFMHAKLPSSPNLTIIVTAGSVLGLVMLTIGWILKRRGLLSLLFNPLNVNIESSPDNRLFLSQLRAKCQLCNGDVLLKKDSLGVCNRNTNHLYSFDHTSLSGKLVD